MQILPSCAYYLRRLLKPGPRAKMGKICDLLERMTPNPQNLEQRLQSIYGSQNYRDAVILHLETLSCSHQHAHSHHNQVALRHFSQHILWWLAYDVDDVSAEYSIFVVDDTLEILKLVHTILAQKGYQVGSALNGQLGLQMIESQPPDVVLLDLSLPDMDGYDVYQRLQASAHTRQIPVVFMSGQEQTRPSAQTALASVPYLAKPFKPDTLIAQVRQALGNPGLSCETEVSTVTAALDARQQAALQLRSQTLLGVVNDTLHLQPYFFRATLNGRYVRVSEPLAQLWGYPNPEALIAQVTNLWQQLYHNAQHQKRWNQCSQYPNQMQTWFTEINTPHHGTLRVEEHVCLVQDTYQHLLFFQGYLTPLP